MSERAERVLDTVTRSGTQQVARSQRCAQGWGEWSALQRVGPCAEPLSLVVTARPLSIGCGNDERALLALLQSQMVGRLLEALGTVALK